ncbi:MAG: GNAT family N-acetyltransferase [Nocardioides sp.]
MDPRPATAWRQHALDWFTSHVDDSTSTHLPVIDVQGSLVAAAIGTVELGVPNPYCPRGRAVRLANVITLPVHRGRGYATELIRDVIEWAEVVGADRIDLSATQDGQRIYEQLGFAPTSAPRMKLVL